MQWTNNLNNSIALVDEAGTQARSVSGLSLYGSVSRGPATVQVAHVRALDEYDNALGLSGNEPTSTSVEATYESFAELYDRPLTGTLVHERTDEWAGHPEHVHGMVVDVPLFPGTTGSVQYLERDYGSNSTLNEERLVSARLAVGFEELLGGVGSDD